MAFNLSSQQTHTGASVYKSLGWAIVFISAAQTLMGHGSLAHKDSRQHKQCASRQQHGTDGDDHEHGA